MSVSVPLSLCLPRVRMHRANNFSRRRHADTNFGDHELREWNCKRKKKKENKNETKGKTGWKQTWRPLKRELWHTCNDRNSVYFYKSLPTIRRATPIATCNDTPPLMRPCKICRRSFCAQSNAGRMSLSSLNAANFGIEKNSTSEICVLFYIKYV